MFLSITSILLQNVSAVGILRLLETNFQILKFVVLLIVTYIWLYVNIWVGKSTPARSNLWTRTLLTENVWAAHSVLKTMKLRFTFHSSMRIMSGYSDTMEYFGVTKQRCKKIIRFWLAVSDPVRAWNISIVAHYIVTHFSSLFSLLIVPACIFIKYMFTNYMVKLRVTHGL